MQNHAERHPQRHASKEIPASLSLKDSTQNSGVCPRNHCGRHNSGILCFKQQFSVRPCKAFAPHKLGCLAKLVTASHLMIGLAPLRVTYEWVIMTQVATNLQSEPDTQEISVPSLTRSPQVTRDCGVGMTWIYIYIYILTKSKLIALHDGVKCESRGHRSNKLTASLGNCNFDSSVCPMGGPISDEDRRGTPPKADKNCIVQPLSEPIYSGTSGWRS